MSNSSTKRNIRTKNAYEIWQAWNVNAAFKILFIHFQKISLRKVLLVTLRHVIK